MNGKQNRSWLFTLNNPTLFESATYLQSRLKKHKDFRYAIFQKEMGKNGTPHYQGYIEFSKPVRFAALKKLLSRAHWEARRGTRNEARDYCRKLETKVGSTIEIGIWNANGAGNRSDLQAVVDLVAGGSDLRTVVTNCPTLFIKYHRGIEKLFQYYKPPRSGAIRVILYYGPSRTGKTYDCYSKWGTSMFRKNCTSKWFDRYSGEEVLLLDDFGCSKQKLQVELLLTILDQYSPLHLEVKTGTIEMLANTIVVTTNLHPKLWYPGIHDESYLALGERFSEIYWYKSRGERFQLNKALFLNGWTEGCDMTRYILIPNTPMDTNESESESDEEEVPRPATQTVDLTLSEDESEDLADCQ